METIPDPAGFTQQKQLAQETAGFAGKARLAR